MPSRAAVPCRVVLLLAAALCLGSAILLNEFTLAWLDFRASPPPGTERAIRIRQLGLLGLAMLLGMICRRGDARPVSDASLRVYAATPLERLREDRCPSST